MNILILFRDGLSGHYLRALINDTPDELGFRVDPWYPGIYDNLQESAARNASSSCHCTHKLSGSLSNYDLMLSILVYRKIYHAIYNHFYKKLLVEQLDLRTRFERWQQESTFWYDTAFYNIKEYYDLFRRDHVENTLPNIINFDLMLDIDYIEEIFKKYLSRPITYNTKRLVTSYGAKQLQYDLSGDEKDMKDILDQIPDDEFSKSPWFAAYCIFKYENNNHLSELQRLWSIDQIDDLIDKKILLSIATQYD